MHAEHPVNRKAVLTAGCIVNSGVEKLLDHLCSAGSI